MTACRGEICMTIKHLGDRVCMKSSRKSAQMKRIKPTKKRLKLLVVQCWGKRHVACGAMLRLSDEALIKI